MPRPLCRQRTIRRAFASPAVVVGVLVGCLVVGASLGCQGGAINQVEVAPPPTSLDRSPLIEQARPHKDAPVFYSPPTLSQRLSLQHVLPAFFRDLADGQQRFDAYEGRFDKAGLRMHRLLRGDEVWIVLTEGGSDWRGTGTYVFRTGEVGEELIVQAPHSYHDYHTGSIAERMFHDAKIRGFFFNTCHRYRPFPEHSESEGADPADLAHATDSYFHLFSVEYLSRIPEGRMVQVHGFERETLAKNKIGVVLSNGTEEPSAWSRQVRDALGGELDGVEIALYPEDTRYYGATSNAQARWVHSYGRGQFLHVELSRALRDRLDADDELLYQLRQGIFASP
ncbi:MAG: hypothetical protein ACLFVJ_02810 [Persicimonas sp.]